MTVRGNFAAGALAVLLTMLPRGVAESGPRGLKVGDAFPKLTGQALSGRQVNLPMDAGKGSALVVLAFSRAGGRDAQTWEQHVAKEFPQEAIYNVVFLEAVPRLFRRAAISGIRGGMPAALHDRTILLYGDEGLWEQRLHAKDESGACLVLLGPNGNIRWIGWGPFAEPGYAAWTRESKATPR